MVVRIFKAQVKPEWKKDFENFFRYEAVPFMRVQEGIVNVITGRPLSPDENDFIMITTWENIDFLRKFMDNEWDKDKVVRDEKNMLESSMLQHFEIM